MTGIVQDYPPLFDEEGSQTAQFVSPVRVDCSARSMLTTILARRNTR